MTVYILKNPSSTFICSCMLSMLYHKHIHMIGLYHCAVFRIWNPKLSGAYIYIMINQWIRKLQTVNCLSLVIANNASKKMSIVVVISHRLTYLEYYLYVVVAKIRFKIQTNNKQLWYQHKSKQVTETCLQNTKTKSNDSYFFR